MEHKDLLIGHMEDLAVRALKTGWAASRFLTPAEAFSVGARFKNRRDVSLCFDGGFEGAERLRAIVLNSDWGRYEREEVIGALKIECRPQDAPGHRDILGALMSLGIERDTIGDIVAWSAEDLRTAPDETVCGARRTASCATMAVMPELCAYITENLTKIRNAGVRVSIIGLDELSARIERVEVRTHTVASLRLDAVLCAALCVSRAKSGELISAGRVSVDHQPCIQPDKELSAGALLSVRGMGRVRLLETGGTSRKGRTYIKIGLYGR